MISKELLNKNRVLTMSNNRKCNYLIIDCGKDLTTMMGINIQGNRKDILIIKSFVNRKFAELVEEAYWLCNEFGISIILADKLGMGLGFIETFKANIKQNEIQIREINGLEIANQILVNEIINDLNNGLLRFLQTPELAKMSYQKPFLGLSNIMEYHRETNELINEINNIEFKAISGNVKLSRIDDIIGKTRVNCLFMFYAYPTVAYVDNKEYEVQKRINKYNISKEIFLKYIYKCIDNEKINVIFYHSGSNKIRQFYDFLNEERFQTLIKSNVKDIKLSKENLEIIFFNGSSIRFIFAGNNARGYRYHFAVVDTGIDKEIFDNVVRCKGILFDIAKREGRLKEDNYNIEFLDI
jgi:hypothetical protein